MRRDGPMVEGRHAESVSSGSSAKTAAVAVSSHTHTILLVHATHSHTPHTDAGYVCVSCPTQLPHKRGGSTSWKLKSSGVFGRWDWGELTFVGALPKRVFGGGPCLLMHPLCPHNNVPHSRCPGCVWCQVWVAPGLWCTPLSCSFLLMQLHCPSHHSRELTAP